MSMTSRSMVLAIDQGTTNTKCVLVDRAGKPVFRFSTPVALITRQPGFVEQNAEDLWLSVRTVAAMACRFSQEHAGTIEGIAISNQRETAVAWDSESGEALCPAISWQCRRSITICNRLRQHAAALRQITGLPLDPVLSATKWAWMLETFPEVQAAARDARLRLGTVDAWLVHRLTGGAVHATDFTNASRTGLLDLATLQWSKQALALYGIPATALPALSPSNGYRGRCTAISGLEDVPIVAVIGDSHAALAGHGTTSTGSLKATYGTGSSLMALTPMLVQDVPSLARTIAWTLGSETQFALEGNVFMTGSAVQWVGEFLSLQSPAQDAAALAELVPDAAGMYLVPAMVGLGSPHWCAEARGLICGLERTHTSAHMARAAVESIAYQVADVFFAMRDTASMHVAQLHVDGGATRNSSLMQFQADILGVPVLRSKNEELSALGAACLGRLTLGWSPSLDALAALPRENDTFIPAISLDERQRLYDGWLDAVRRTCPSSQGDA